MLRRLRSDSVSAIVAVFVAFVAAAGCGDDDYDNTPDPTAPAYDLYIDVASDERIGALQFDITHLGDSGAFIGNGDKIDCVAMVDALVAANYRGERRASVGLISVPGVRTPARIVRCGFRTRENVGPDSFQIDVTDASGVDSEPIDPVPTVVVSSVSPR